MSGKRLRLEALEKRDMKAVADMWIGEGANYWFDNPDNWQAGVIPSAGDDLVLLGGVPQSTAMNDLPAYTPFHSLSLAGGCTLMGNPPVLSGEIYNEGDNALNCPTAFSVDAVFHVIGGELTINGPINAAGHAVTIDIDAGASAIVMTPILGASSLTKTGDGNMLLGSSPATELSNLVIRGGIVNILGKHTLTDGAALTVGG